MTMNPKILFLLCVTIPFVLISPSFAAVKKAPVGAVIAWTGDVYLYHENEPKGINIKGMEGVYPLDTIITSVKSKVKVLMNDDSVLNLGENAKLVVKDYSLVEENDKRVSVMKLFIGTVRVLAGRVFRGSESRFQIETPTAVGN
jgi:hypothetical protein